MKKHFTKLMAVILSMCMMVTTAGIASAFDDIPEDVPEVSSGEESGAVLPDDTFAGDWQLKVDEASNVKYWELDAIYVKNPTEGITTSSDDGLVQHIKVWAPEAYIKDGVLNKDGKVVSSTGLVYTAENAPIVYRNHSGGYTSSKINGVDIDYIVEGCVYSEIQTRGKEIQNKEGKYIGQFPVLIADMKAGIRFLRYFDSVLPGDSERIVSTGHSSGGAVSAMLGASGDSKIFDPYLEEIGAYEASDAIWIAHASAPITNLSSADASYEWYQTSNPTYFLFNSMAVDREGNPIENFPVGPQNKYPLGSNVLGGAHEDELSAILYDDFVDYVQGMGLDLGDDGRSGEFYEGFIEIYEDALAEYIARFDELKAAGAQAVASAPATAAEYLASLDKAGTGWVKYDEATGKVDISDLDTLVKNHIQRKKMCPSLDSYNYKSNENDAFKDEDGNTIHFSGQVYDALKELLDGYNAGTINITGKKDAKTGEQSEFTAEDLAYLEALTGDYETAGREEDRYMLEVMSPVNYILGGHLEGYDDFEATSAEHWRLRIGSEDGDHGAPAAWLIYEALKKYQPDIDAQIGIAWGLPHTWSELLKQDFFDYIAGLMKEDAAPGEFDTCVFTDDADGLFKDADAAAWFKDGDVKSGVEAIIKEGKFFVNGKALPKSADDEAALSDTDTRGEAAKGFAINGFVSFYQMSDGTWSSTVHKGGTAIPSFEDGIIEFAEGLTKMTGLTTTLIDEDLDGYADRIEKTVKEVVRLDELKEQEDGSYKISYGNWGINFSRREGAIDLNEEAVFAAENVDSALKEQDMALYWEDTDGWHLEKPESVTGRLTDGVDHGYYIFEGDKYTDCNVTKFYLAQGNRPGQYMVSHLNLNLQDEDVIMWTVGGYPFGFTSPDAKAMLEKAVNNAKAISENTVISSDGQGVDKDHYWADTDTLKKCYDAIAEAEVTLARNDATETDYDLAVYKLGLAVPVQKGTCIFEFTDNSDGLFADEDAAAFFKDGDIKAGVEEILNAGKFFVNGKALPRSEDDTEALSDKDAREDLSGFAVNGLLNLYKNAEGTWTQTVHKGVADGASFEEARAAFAEGVTKMSGLTTELYDDDGDGICDRIGKTVKEVVRVDKLIKQEDGTIKISRGNAPLGKRDGSLELNDIAVFAAENFDPELKEQDMAFYWLIGKDEWHIEKAPSVEGKLTDGEDHGYYIFDGSRLTDCNITKYYLATGNRPGQYLMAHLAFGLQDEPVIMWTAGTYPFGYTSADSRDMLTKAVAKAKTIAAETRVSADGSDVLESEKWMSQEEKIELEKKINSAEALITDASASDTDRDLAIYQMYQLLPKNNGTASEVTDITGALEMATASSVKLDAKAEPFDALDKDITWRSSNEKVASVDSEGLVTAHIYGQATITASASNGTNASWDIQTRYYDVYNKLSQYYYDAVYWAADNGITRGYGDVYFGPERECERREMVIFLWRMAGCPEVGLNVYETFSDMSAFARTTDTYKAVAWGVQAGIIKGYTDGTFRPRASVTRKDTMIMIYRLAGKPEVSGKISFADIDYDPVKTPDTYHAILWADKENISHGYLQDNTYRPDENCLREHIVTFLYRAKDLIDYEYEGPLYVGAGTAPINFDPEMFGLSASSISGSLEDWRNNHEGMEGFNGRIADVPSMRVLLLTGGTRAAFVSAELVTVGDRSLEVIRKVITEKTGIPAEKIWIAATHAITTPHEPKEDPELTMYLKSVEDAITAAADEAVASEQEAVIGTGHGKLDIIVNRNIDTPEGIEGVYYGKGSTYETNDDLYIVRFDSAETGDPIAFYVSYSIKPTAIDNSEMAEGNRAISADIPGVACRMMEEEYGAPCLFAMPAAGDQYPKEMALYYEFDLEKKEAVTVDLGVEAGLDIVARLGREMGDACVELADTIKADEANAVVKMMTKGLSAETYDAKKDEHGTSVYPVSALTVGSVAWIGVKPEIDVHTQYQLWEASPFDTTMFVASLSSQSGKGKYMPHAEAWDMNNGKGSYEVNSAIVVRGTAEKMVDLAVEILNELK